MTQQIQQSNYREKKKKKANSITIIAAAYHHHRWVGFSLALSLSLSHNAILFNMQ